MSVRMICAALSLSLGLVAAGCEEAEPNEPNDNQEKDAGPRDSGPRDSGSRDAGQQKPPMQSGGDDAAVASSDAKIGDFNIQLVAPKTAAQAGSDTPGFTEFKGAVFDAPAAAALIWEPSETVDDCTLLIPRIPFCEEPCSGAICIEDDVCQRSPASRTVGTLTVKGLKTEANATEFMIPPPKSNIYQAPASVKLPYPAFAEGDAIEIAAEGDALGPFTLKGKGIAPLALTADKPYPLAPDQPLALAWTPPGMQGISKIFVKLDISHHGGAKGKVECDTDDDGSLSIPASMIGKLIKLGTAGFPSVTVTRQAVSSTSTPLGTVGMKVFSYVERPVEIPGVVSCTESSECPSGNCRDNKTCG
jgi:hypothetical protein